MNTSSLMPLPLDRESWLINQQINPVFNQQFHTDCTFPRDTVCLTGMGSVSFLGKLSADTWLLTVQLEQNPAYFASPLGKKHPLPLSSTVLFSKSDRDSYSGHGSLGLRFSAHTMDLVTYAEDHATVLRRMEVDADFTQPETIRIRKIVKADETAALTISVLSTSEEFHCPIPRGTDTAFFGLIHDQFSTKATLSHVYVNGTVFPYHSPSPVPPIYGEDYFETDGMRLIHWEWRQNYPIYRALQISDESGRLLASVPFPEKHFVLPADLHAKELRLTAVNADGKKATPRQLILEDDHAACRASVRQDRIAIRETDGPAEFYHTATGERFIADGVNYVRLRCGDHSNFEPDCGFMPAEYDMYSVETMLKLLKKSGMNTVRVFLCMGRNPANPGLAGDYETTVGIDPVYMANFIDFLKRARAYGIYVIPALGDNELPNNRWFVEMAGDISIQSSFFSESALRAKTELVCRVVQSILDADPDLADTLLCLQTQNEFNLSVQLPPLNQTSGSFTFYADGRTYDMADMQARRALANAAVRHYYHTIHEALRRIAPTLLLSVGTFSLRAVGKTVETHPGLYPDPDLADPRFPLTVPEMMACDIDFFDLHCYNAPGSDGDGVKNQNLDVENMKISTPEGREALRRKPLIMGEYGSFMFQQKTWEEGKKWILDSRDTAMSNGYSGHLLWEFDSFCQNLSYCAMYDGGDFLRELSWNNREKETKKTPDT